MVGLEGATVDGIFIGLVRFILGIVLMIVGLWEITLGHWAPGLAFMGVGIIIFGFPGVGMAAGGADFMVRGPTGVVLIVIGAILYALNIGR
jgi:hypothetical protein